MKLAQRVINKQFVGLCYSGEVTPLPGCADIAVSHAVYCHNGSGGGGGREAMQQRLLQLKELGYSAVMCTVNAENARQLHILEKEGWTIGLDIHNKRTKNRIRLCYREL